MAKAKERLTDEQRARIENDWDRAEAIARKFARRYRGLDVDWLGAVALGAVDAAGSYREDAGATFRTYLGNRCHGACLDAMRRCRLKGYGRVAGESRYGLGPAVVSLDADRANQSGYSAESGGHESMNFHAMLPSDEDPVGYAMEWADEVERLSRSLPRLHGEAIRRLYLGAGTIRMKDAGRAMGCSESRVSQLHADAIGYLREHLAS